jgi:catechol 2,3-dioxygenase-like lactoylglutathione lyase family enzyme
MPITDRSTKEPLIKAQRIGHGTLEVTDLQSTRRFYEEVLGLECIQVSTMSMVAKLGTEHTYAVVASGNKDRPEMSLFNHNGLDVGSREEVDRIRTQILAIKDEWGIKKIGPISTMHGDYSFYFCDLDGNWWEIVAAEPGGYAAGFEDPLSDLTGLHEFDDEKGMLHTHDPKNRDRIKAARERLGSTAQ